MCRGVAYIVDTANLQVGCCVGRGHRREPVQECMDETNQEYGGLRCGSRRRDKARKGCWPGLAAREGDRAFEGMDSRLLQEEVPGGWSMVGEQYAARDIPSSLHRARRDCAWLEGRWAHNMEHLLHNLIPRQLGS